MTKLPSIKDCTDLKGKRVLLRASLNVPISEDGVITNHFRIMRAMPTINHLRNEGAKVIVIAHIGRDQKETLKPVHAELEKLVEAKWAPALLGEETESASATLSDGEVLVLENVRSDPREKDNDPTFAAALAAYGDIYVNDAFAASHRAHASLTGVCSRLPSYFGFNFMHEYEELTKAAEPTGSALLILGGAKFDTKMPLVEKYADKYTKVFIGGALANDIYKARGLEIGTSLVSDVDLAGHPIMERDNIIVPIDVTVKGEQGVRTTTPNDVQPDETILDAGPRTIEMLASELASMDNVLWNGPLGDYEHGFNTETESLAKVIAEAKAYAVVGGGDTIAAIESLCLQEHFGFLSTAGGAMLTFLENGTLPAITAVIGE